MATMPAVIPATTMPTIAVPLLATAVPTTTTTTMPAAATSMVPVCECRRGCQQCGDGGGDQRLGHVMILQLGIRHRLCVIMMALASV